VAITGFAAWNLYEWYAVGQMIVSRSGPPASFHQAPISFSLMAIAYVSWVLLVGAAAIKLLAKVLRRR
jgi:hypothetical protein